MSDGGRTAEGVFDEAGLRFGWKVAEGERGVTPSHLVMIVTGKDREAKAVIDRLESTLWRLKIALRLERKQRRSASGEGVIARGAVTHLGMWSFPSDQYDDVVNVIRWAQGDEELTEIL